MAASAALPAMRWAIASAGGVTKDTTAGGQHDIVVDRTNPTIKQFTLFLPWVAGPDEGTVQICATLSSIMWSTTKLQDGSSAFTLELHRGLLAPSKMLEIILELSELGFLICQLPVDTWFLAVDRLVSFVSSGSDAEFKLGTCRQSILAQLPKLQQGCAIPKTSRWTSSLARCLPLSPPWHAWDDSISSHSTVCVQ